MREIKMSKLIAVNDGIILDFINDENYQVLPDGRILTCINKQGHNTGVWREKTQTKNRGGYLRIKYNYRHLKVHRIIYAKFIGPLKKNKVINHKDGNPSNNSVGNLEQITQAENNLHSFRVLGRKANYSTAKINQEIADEIRRQVAEENLRACDMARKYNLTKSTISAIINNKIWKAS